MRASLNQNSILNDPKELLPNEGKPEVPKRAFVIKTMQIFQYHAVRMNAVELASESSADDKWLSNLYTISAIT